MTNLLCVDCGRLAVFLSEGHSLCGGCHAARRRKLRRKSQEEAASPESPVKSEVNKGAADASPHLPH